MIESRRKWSNFSPFNNTTNSAAINESQQQLGNSSTRTFTNSELIQRWHDSQCSFSSESTSSFMDILPPSPSPNCSSFSPYSIITCSPSSDIFYPQSSSEFSTPRNKSLCARSNDAKLLTSADELDQEIRNRNINNLCNFYQPNWQSKDLKEVEDVEHENSPKHSSYTSKYQPIRTSKHLVNMPLLVVNEEQVQQNRSNDDYEDEDLDSHSIVHGYRRLMNRPKPYQVFLDEIKKKELENQANAWKEAKCLRLVNKLRRQEAWINERELKQNKKATIEMKKIESKLERKRAKALENMQKKISKTQRKAEEKMARERHSIIKEISTVLESQTKIKATGNNFWLNPPCFL